MFNLKESEYKKIINDLPKGAQVTKAVKYKKKDSKVTRNMFSVEYQYKGENFKTSLQNYCGIVNKL